MNPEILVISVVYMLRITMWGSPLTLIKRQTPSFEGAWQHFNNKHPLQNANLAFGGCILY